MFTNKEDIARVLFLDIETVRNTHTFEELSPEMQYMWQHKAGLLKIDNEQSVTDKYYERAGIYAEFGKIVCISVGFIYWTDDQPFLKIKSFYGFDEKVILTEFKALLDTKMNKDWYLCAHNGREFDFPYLGRRFLINQIALPNILKIQGKKPWEVSFLDTMELWKFGDYKSYTKLELLCAVFGVPTPKDEMDGSMVSTVFWEDKDPAKIAKYCEKDVVATAQVFMKYCVLPLIDEQNILSSFEV
jgi:3'-5' exonuclease